MHEPRPLGWMPLCWKKAGHFQKRLKLSTKGILQAAQVNCSQVWELTVTYAMVESGEGGGDEQLRWNSSFLFCDLLGQAGAADAAGWRGEWSHQVWMGRLGNRSEKGGQYKADCVERMSDQWSINVSCRPAEHWHLYAWAPTQSPQRLIWR